MALILAKEIDSTGIDAHYWKITDTVIDWHTQDAVIVVKGWKDAAARNDPTKDAAEEIRYDWSGEAFPFDDVDPVQPAAYTILKALPEWDGAVDA